MRLYVGNLSYSTSPETLQTEFEAFGTVDEVAIINDRDTGRPRGFAFVTMGSHEDGQNAIENLNGCEVDGRTITVNEARPRAERSNGRSW